MYELCAGYDPFSHEDPMIVYENILSCRLKFSKSFDSNAKSLVKKFLEIDLSKRYGNTVDGVNIIKNHKFFKGTDFDRLLYQELKPPYIPRVKSNNDLSNFPNHTEIQNDFQANKPLNDPFLEWVK